MIIFRLWEHQTHISKIQTKFSTKQQQQRRNDHDHSNKDQNVATRTSLLVCCFFSLLILFFEIVYFDLTSDSILVNLLFELIGVRERTHNNQPTRHHIAIRHNHILLQYIFELFAVVGFLFVTLQSRNLLCLKFVCQKSDTKKTKWWKSLAFFFITVQYSIASTQSGSIVNIICI